ncbi:MAG: cytochrome P450 [Sphingorhabdus sp.]
MAQVGNEVVASIGGIAVPGHVAPDLVRKLDYVAGPEFLKDPYAYLSTVVESWPRITFSPGVEGGWMVTRFEDVREVLQNNTVFSSRGIASVVARDEANHSDQEGGFELIPLELDPPRHAKYRMMLNPVFSPKEIEKLDADIRRVATNLVDAIKHNKQCDFVSAVARPLPTIIFLRMMGLPEDQADIFVHWTVELIHSHDPVRQKAATDSIMGVLFQLVAERKQSPRDDIISKIVALKIEDKPLPETDIMGFCFLLFIAGLDTVTSTLTNMFRYLADTPDYRKQLVANPDLIPEAAEELLRAFAVVTTSRFVAQDIDIFGVTMKKGDRVTVVIPAANRDPEEFEEPRAIRIARGNNRHITFSAGPHRCIGSHLARREIRIILEEFLRQIPDFSVDPAKPFKIYGGGVIGYHSLPLRWQPRPGVNQ